MTDVFEELQESLKSMMARPELVEVSKPCGCVVTNQVIKFCPEHYRQYRESSRVGSSVYKSGQTQSFAGIPIVVVTPKDFATKPPEYMKPSGWKP